MVSDGYEVEHVTDLAPARMAEGVVHALMPQGRYANARGLPLNRYGPGHSASSRCSGLSEKRGPSVGGGAGHSICGRVR